MTFGIHTQAVEHVLFKIKKKNPKIFKYALYDKSNSLEIKK